MITLNGKPAPMLGETTVAGALRELGIALETRGIAVAVDGEVVPRGSWDAWPLRDGARVEVVTAMQGG